LSETEFVSPADRSVALSLILSPLMRGAVEKSPIHALTSPTSGSGKSFVVHMAQVIATGQQCAPQAAAKSGEELQKRIETAILAGRSLISLDNINGKLESELLCQAVTEPMVWLRILSKSYDVLVVCRSVFAATGNNLNIAKDLDRRTL